MNGLIADMPAVSKDNFSYSRIEKPDYQDFYKSNSISMKNAQVFEEGKGVKILISNSNPLMNYIQNYSKMVGETIEEKTSSCRKRQRTNSCNSSQKDASKSTKIEDNN